jgi:hypothetical protein
MRPQTVIEPARANGIALPSADPTGCTATTLFLPSATDVHEAV